MRQRKQDASMSLDLCDHYGELFTWMAALYFKNAEVQPLLQLLLSFFTDLALLTE